jgi:uncharacterized protein
MTYVAVQYTYTDDAAGRDELRPRHREFLASQPGLVLSGPTASAGADGAIIVYEADSAEVVEAFMADDPFWTAGLVADRSVAAWSIGMGSWKDQLGI